MTTNEIISFLLPQFNDPIQTIFLLIILIMMLGTVLFAWRYANKTSWEKKWNRGTSDNTSDDLDIEHGSVTDLWHAVATGPEKAAEIMPGMLLVIGLLGTFLGLGLALNKASSILSQPGAMDASAAADSMSHLMGLLQGLGTKFKTSTWGITGFVLLKIWNEAMRYEEKRMTWVIGKVKTELEKRKQEEKISAFTQRSELHEQIALSSQKIVESLGNQFEKLFVLEKSIHKASMVRFDAQLQEMSATKENMQTFTQSTENIVGQMAEASERMAGGADQIGIAGKELVGAIEQFKDQFTNVLDDVRKDLGKSIQDMSTQASSTLEKGSEQLSSATREISSALGVLSQDVNKTMTEVKDSIGKALDIQKRASNEFTLSAENLNENITATTNIVGELATPITAGLRSVSEAGQQMRGVGNRLEKSLETMEKLVASLNQLPDHHQRTVSVLTPLSTLPSGQQQMLQEMQGLRAELKSILTMPKVDTDHLVTGDIAS